MLHADAKVLALVGVALVGACVSFPEVIDSADATTSSSTTGGGGGAGATTASSGSSGGLGGNVDVSCQGVEMGEAVVLGCLDESEIGNVQRTETVDTTDFDLRFAGLTLSWYDGYRGYHASTQLSGNFAVALRVEVELEPDGAGGGAASYPGGVYQMAGLLLDGGSDDWIKWEIGYRADFDDFGYFGARTENADTTPLGSFPEPPPPGGQVLLGACRIGDSVYLKHHTGSAWASIDHSLLGGGGFAESLDVTDFNPAFAVGFTVQGFDADPRIIAKVDYLRFATGDFDEDACDAVLEQLRDGASCAACTAGG